MSVDLIRSFVVWFVPALWVALLPFPNLPANARDPDVVPAAGAISGHHASILDSDSRPQDLPIQTTGTEGRAARPVSRPSGLEDERSGDVQSATESRPVGTLAVCSDPVECRVVIERELEADRYGSAQVIEKREPETMIPNLETGRYRISAARDEVTLVADLDLANNDIVTVIFDFAAKSVKTTSAQESRRIAAERRAEQARREKELERAERIRREQELKRAERARREEEWKRADQAMLEAGGFVVDLGAGVTMNMVSIKAGRFARKAAKEGDADAQVLQEVAINECFWLGQTEVTQAQWNAMMGDNPSRFHGHPDRPVEQVSWNDAVEFCRRISERTGMRFRLPSDAEWEYACRSGSATEYSFGDDAEALPRHAWFHGNADEQTHPVRMKIPNNWGLYDMHGNVWEWVNDVVETVDDTALPADEPMAPVAGTKRRLRGGSWINLAKGCRASHQGNAAADDLKNDSFGFRVARSP